MTIPTSYTIRALNRWLAALKLETDSPIIRALHAAVDELDNDPNDLVADAEALLLAAASMSVLSFDALEHAAGEIGLEVDEEDRSEVRESATVMQGLADLLGEIRTRTAEDREVLEADGEDVQPALFDEPKVLFIAPSTSPLDMTMFMRTRWARPVMTEETCRGAALRFFTDVFSDFHSAKKLYIWVQGLPRDGIAPLMSYEVTFTESLADMTVRHVEAMLRDTERKVCDVEIIDEPTPGMTPPPQDVQDLLNT